MYKIFTANPKTEKRLKEYLLLRKYINSKLDKFKENPYRNMSAHKLHGRLKGKWAAWLGSDIRIIYSIEELKKKIIVEAVGSHKIY